MVFYQQALQFLTCFIADASSGRNLFSFCGNGCKAAFLIPLTPQEQLSIGSKRLRATSDIPLKLLNNGDFFKHFATSFFNLKHHSTQRLNSKTSIKHLHHQLK